MYKTTYNTKLNPPKVDGVCDKCGAPLKQREDDSDPKAIERRLKIYDEKTSPLVEYYNKKGILNTETVSIEAGRMGSDVAKELVEKLREVK